MRRFGVLAVILLAACGILDSNDGLPRGTFCGYSFDVHVSLTVVDDPSSGDTVNVAGRLSTSAQYLLYLDGRALDGSPLDVRLRSGASVLYVYRATVRDGGYDGELKWVLPSAADSFRQRLVLGPCAHP